MNFEHYRNSQSFSFDERTWPGKTIKEAPIWCSVDLRDGNQALEVPMNIEQKIKFFKFLVKIGFKEIEIGFPAASDTDYEFTRYLIENDLIPDDVKIQVLTQSRENIIDKTIEAVRGAKNVIIHLYNSTSTVQREVVFGFDKKDCINLAVKGAKIIKDKIAGKLETNWFFEYSPESFSATEPDFAVEICDAVLDVINPTIDNKAIINLPETVQLTTSNVYADQIEYFYRNTKYQDSIILSVHTHNDRGTAIASSEFGLMAGATRVEGTLFGNGERTGNADIVVLAINMMMNGVDPKLDFSNIDDVKMLYEESTGMVVSDRHPWSGKLVFSAFSGSHQDAIKKGMEKNSQNDIWSVPYLPIDPKDVGRMYEPIIRINSQSGRGGVSYVLKDVYGLQVPPSFLKDFIGKVKSYSCANDVELLPQDVFGLFDEIYINVFNPYSINSFKEIFSEDKYSEIEVELEKDGEIITASGEGTGFLDAFITTLNDILNINISINSYSEHSMRSGSNAAAITYIEIFNHQDNNIYLGAGVSKSVTKSSIRAVISAVNRMFLSFI